jgi:folate-dependent phosphoribosylglycinamide formyltransferase PurN
MRIVIVAPSVYSETTCAVAAHLAATGYVPVGAIVLPSFNAETLLRKAGQWGPRKLVSFALGKLTPRPANTGPRLSNSYLRPFLEPHGRVFRSLWETADLHNFRVAIFRDQNSPDSVATMREWLPDLIIFTGGKILRQQVLDVPRLGVLNVHLGLLPEVRGMNSPEWSLLENIPLGITIHYMDAGIDTGPVLQRFEFHPANQSQSLHDLRNRLIAFGVEKVADAVGALDRGAISATPQPYLDKDHQFFVMHEWLQTRAAACLTGNRPVPAETVHG